VLALTQLSEQRTPLILRGPGGSLEGFGMSRVRQNPHHQRPDMPVQLTLINSDTTTSPVERTWLTPILPTNLAVRVRLKLRPRPPRKPISTAPAAHETRTQVDDRVRTATATRGVQRIQPFPRLIVENRLTRQMTHHHTVVDDPAPRCAPLKTAV
jgi:hypothetical protein